MIGSVAIGRAREEAMVATVVAAAIDGHGGALVVRGEPGIGKSTLLEHARACADEAVIVEASGVEVEGRSRSRGSEMCSGPSLARGGREIWDDAAPAADASGVRAQVGCGAGVCAGAARQDAGFPLAQK